MKNCTPSILTSSNNTNLYPVGCVIMASGVGSRFGGDKLMVDFGDRPMIDWVLEATSDLFQSRIVVTRNQDVKAYCEKKGIEVIYHEMPGQNDTVRLGVEHMPGSVKGCMFFVSDQPFLTKTSIKALLDAAVLSSDKIWRVAYKDRVGAPVYFPVSLFSELRNCHLIKAEAWLLKIILIW